MSRAVVFICALALCGCLVFTREYRTVERMTWHPMPPDWHGMRGGPDTVVLSWESAPDHHILINSPDLLQRLQNAGKRIIDVEFQVWGEFGKLRGFNPLLVESKPFHESPQGPGGSAATGSSPGPHPLQRLFD